MDTLTHAIVGVAAASLSGQSFLLENPIYLASLLGSQAPDFDIIALLRGKFAFIRQHRSFSHSLPGLITWAALISGTLYFFMPNEAPLPLFGWTLLAALSHVVLDYFNTHGAAVLWPFCQERKSLHLLNVFDPVLLLLLLSLYLVKIPPLTFGLLTFASLSIYITLRFYLRYNAKKQLIEHFKDQQLLQLVIMPSLKKVFVWDFIVETVDHHYVGQIKAFGDKLEFRANLPRQEKLSEITEKVQSTRLGNFFNTFTPFAYYEEERTMNTLQINIYDLRYYLNQQFIHRATIVFNDFDSPTASYLYSEGKVIKVPC